MPSFQRLLAAVPIVMAAALGATVLSSYAHVRTARETLLRGQADAILQVMFREVQELGGPGEVPAAELLELLRPSGVTCLVFFGPEDRPRSTAGECPDAPAEALASVPRGEVLDLGDRARLARRRPPPPGGRGAGPGGALLVEFEPSAVRALEAGAARTLAIGAAASLALIATGIAAWRLSLRAERLQQQRQRERHLAVLGEMAAVLSHEIRNPLASLKGHAQLLSERLPAGGAEREKAERLVREAQRLERLSEDLLGIVRSDRVERREADPVSLLREAAEAAGDGQLDLDVAGAPRSWPLDTDRVHQLLTNLLRNALQASPPGHRARAAVREEGGLLVFRVRDDGEGIPHGEEDRIFEPFHTTRLHGTGLGLTVARRIAEAHGGDLVARNLAGGGAEFCARLARG